MDQLELVEAFRADKLTVSEYLSQIKRYFSSREPSVLAFVAEAKRFERLHNDAEELILRFPNPQKRPPLFGVLTGVKDIFHVSGFNTQAGSHLPPKDLQGIEAGSVTKLKNAGMLILGKTVTTEFAYFSPGPTRNPHNSEHTPGGSSSGSAAAVGAGLCPFALGTQTIGSVTRPAAFCGVVGVKPTYGRISRNGVIPLSPTFDHVGFFTPNASMAKLAAPFLYNDWDNSIKLEKKPVLGIPDGPYLESASSMALESFNRTCETLIHAGYELRHIRIMEDYPAIRARHDVIMSAEAAREHATWFEKYAEKYSSKFTELIRRGQAVSDSQLQDALNARDNLRTEIRRAMIDNDIALWIAPSAPGPAPKGLESTGDPVMNLPWTQAGLPSISLPSGKTEDGLPLGLQVVANWYKDESLLSWAEDIEKVVSAS